MISLLLTLLFGGIILFANFCFTGWMNNMKDNPKKEIRFFTGMIITIVVFVLLVKLLII